MNLMEKLKNVSSFKGLKGGLTEEFLRLCIVRNFQKGQTLFLRGEQRERVFFLLSGEVKLYRSQGGRKVVIQVLREGDFFGDLSFAHPYPLEEENQVVAVSDSEVCIMTQQELKNFLKKYPEFALVILSAVRNRLHHAECKIRDLALSSAQTRLINELLRYAVQHGHLVNGQYEIGKHLTHQALSEMIGVTRETVTKTMQLLKDLGFLEYVDGRSIRLNQDKILADCIECVRLQKSANVS